MPATALTSRRRAACVSTKCWTCCTNSMRRFWDGLAGGLRVLWIGGMWAIGYVAAPVLFANLGDKQLAGMLAGRLFAVMAWIGIAAAVYLLAYRLVRDGAAALKTLFFWAVGLMLVWRSVLAK